MLFILSSIALLIFAYASLWFLLSVLLRRNDVADVAWGLGYVLIAAYLYQTQTRASIPLLVYALVCTWALRLSTHIFLRNWGKKEDFRYRQWREEWGNNFYLRSYLQVYLLQGLLLSIVALPLIVAGVSGVEQWSFFTYLGLGFWAIGFFFQAVGDHQLARFLKTRQNKEEILQTGLWKYSRHPNYFGEILMWWGIAVITLPLPWAYLSLLGPVTITVLLVFVSGVPLLEKRYHGNPHYAAYKARTNVLIPWIPKSAKA
jgi:steroid 5-alpha reductase family enzyme